MRRSKQLSPSGEPEHLPSTTRAVAWGAMFFAFLSFAVSLTTLFLTYKDGRLVDNFDKLMKDVKGAIPESEARDSDNQATMRAKVRDQLDRYAEMARNGNKEARYYLDSLGSDLARLQAYGSEDAKKWMADARKTIESARDQIGENGPEAAQKLRDLSDRLGGAVKSVRAAVSPDSPSKEKSAPDPPAREDRPVP